MSRVNDRNRDVLKTIIESCKDLRSLATEINEPMIAHLLEMIITQARDARAGDGAEDGKLR